ncbi:unnamed protein product [Phaedon cochleariae]|uniref:Glutathione synthetase n=1 Tax=Phaedon cochleariae TaxID=80249 RepID=A0A9N9SDH3_PHACE|nr:unnamed protein product [Phaedon cochleariae]
MSQNMLPRHIPLPIPNELLQETVSKSKDWMVAHGCAMRKKNDYSEDTVQIVPFIVLPSTIPRKEFNKVVRLQTVLNELMHRVAHDHTFLEECFKDAIEVDDFSANLFKIYEAVREEGICQAISVGLFRSDYLLHSASNNVLKQVELNTVSASFSGIGPCISQFHRYILEELGHHDKIKNLPENNALTGSAQGLLDAWKLYGDSDSIIIFLVEEITHNICDQRMHEFEIRRLNPRVKVLRRTFTDIYERASLNANKELIIDGYTVGLVYFRIGYEPANYPSQKDWDARLLIERSRALKCPSILYHLAGQKKVQQALAQPGVVDRYLTETDKINAIKELFVGLYGLEFNEMGERAVQMALSEPERFVLKPQREGGGFNKYGQDVKKFMLEVQNSKERTAWIMMERIQPPTVMGYAVIAGQPNPPPLKEMVSELGIYGVLIGSADKINVNEQVGHLVRTKSSSMDEGGILAGAGALDSPYLIDL